MSPLISAFGGFFGPDAATAPGPSGEGPPKSPARLGAGGEGFALALLMAMGGGAPDVEGFEGVVRQLLSDGGAGPEGEGELPAEGPAQKGEGTRASSGAAFHTAETPTQDGEGTPASLIDPETISTNLSRPRQTSRNLAESPPVLADAGEARTGAAPEPRREGPRVQVDADSLVRAPPLAERREPNPGAEGAVPAEGRDPGTRLRAVAGGGSGSPAPMPEASAPMAGSPGAGPVSASLSVSDRDLSKLQPEFRQRLERVMERMRDEHGHRVEVMEGYRSPQRQEYLFAQGRGRSGPVVTWTRDSLHSQGRAADLRIDGSWQNPRGYERLQQIAQEEGLSTLGARDPGHLELPADAGAEKGEGSPTVRDPARPWHPQARVRAHATGSRPRVASPARVAGTAGVAKVASVAVPGRTRGTGKRSSGESVRAASTPEAAGEARGQRWTREPAGDSSSEVSLRGPVGHTHVEASPRKPAGETRSAGPLDGSAEEAGRTPTRAKAASGTDGNGRAPAAPESPARASGLRARPSGLRARPAEQVDSQHAAPGREEERDRGETSGKVDARGSESSHLRPVAGTGPHNPGPTAAARPVSPPTAPASTGADRVEQVMDAREVADLSGVRPLHLDLENADGVGTRLRLDLRGSSLDARIDLRDPASTDRMRARVSELHRALSRIGLDADSLRIQAARAPVEGVEILHETQSASGNAFRLPGLEALVSPRSSSAEGRSQGQTPQGGQGEGRSRDYQQQQNRSREERR